MTSTKKMAILILSSAAGTVIGYGVFLFAGLIGLLMLYGDNGHPPKFLEYSLYYGVSGITTLLGFGSVY